MTSTPHNHIIVSEPWQWLELLAHFDLQKWHLIRFQWHNLLGSVNAKRSWLWLTKVYGSTNFPFSGLESDVFNQCQPVCSYIRLTVVKLVFASYSPSSTQLSKKKKKKKLGLEKNARKPAKERGVWVENKTNQRKVDSYCGDGGASHYKRSL